MAGRTSPAESLDASGLEFAIVWARFNEHITRRLVDGAIDALKEHGAARIAEFDVPGAFELPFACKTLLLPSQSIGTVVGGALSAIQGRPVKRSVYAAVVALGCVIRGETPHFDYVAAETVGGLMQVQLEARIPIAFGVLTCETEEQALARAGGTHGNKGYDAALAAIEMALWARSAQDVWGEN